PADYSALSAALGCPDLFLVDADSGPDQHDFAAELASEAGEAGERVLIVTPTPSKADAIVCRLIERARVPIGRALARSEHPNVLPGLGAFRTARIHSDELLAVARCDARAALAECEARLNSLRAVAAAYEQVQHATDELGCVNAELQTRRT